MKEGAGWVHFVGAGPGPLDLLTLRAERLLRTADLVAFDELVEPELLALTQATCERLGIGYRSRGQGSRHPILHPRVIAAAREGLTVVRLKSGDPLIFGRAAEEMAMLDAEGVPYRIVPGITAALAAASAGAWPLTQKGKACSVRLMTWTSDARLHQGAETLAIYMPRHGLVDLIEELLRQGWPKSTAAAYIQSALRDDQAITEASLETLAHTVELCCDSRPGICLIGETLQKDLIEKLVKRPLIKELANGAGTDSRLHRIGQRQDNSRLGLGFSSPRPGSKSWSGAIY